MTESAVIAAAASVVGLGLAWMLPPILIEWIVGPVGFPVAPDLAVLGYTLTLAVVTCLAFGLAPALHGSRASLTATMSGRTSVPGTHSPLRGALMAVQVAVSIVLLVNASLMVRGVSALASRDVGFDMDGVDVISFALPASYIRRGSVRSRPAWCRTRGRFSGRSSSGSRTSLLSERPIASGRLSGCAARTASNATRPY